MAQEGLGCFRPALASWTKPLGCGFSLLVLATELGPLTCLTGLPSAAHALTRGSFPGHDPDGCWASLTTLLVKPGAGVSEDSEGISMVRGVALGGRPAKSPDPRPSGSPHPPMGC